MGEFILFQKTRQKRFRKKEEVKGKKKKCFLIEQQHDTGARKLVYYLKEQHLRNTNISIFTNGTVTISGVKSILEFFQLFDMIYEKVFPFQTKQRPD